MNSHLQRMSWGEWHWGWCSIEASSRWWKARWMRLLWGLLLVRSGVFSFILDGHCDQVGSCCT